MNFKEHFQNSKVVSTYKFKTKAGFSVEIDYDNSTDEKITGFVFFNTPNGLHKMPVEWNQDGVPLKLPINQGLNLVPIKLEPSYVVSDYESY